MKKFIRILLVFAICVSFASCSSSSDKDNSENLLEKYDSMEYTVYVNIFYNGQGNDYVDKTYTKEGIFATLQDEYNNVNRYYVWGYADRTKCCDYQWEIVLPDGAQIPEDGSLVSFTGTLTADENALDGYWFTDVTLSVSNEKTASEYDYDLTNLSPTLARVQLINMLNFSDVFDGKTVKVYGRVYEDGTIQHPYYDNSWYLDYKGGSSAATGKYVTLGGTFAVSSDGGYVNVASFVVGEK